MARAVRHWPRPAPGRAGEGHSKVAAQVLRAALRSAFRLRTSGRARQAHQQTPCSRLPGGSALRAKSALERRA
eukprot:scaffold31618_cov63-Phaeocystis_antarctica.AAC.2